MSRIDKILTKAGYIPARELHAEGDPKLPIIFQEYVKTVGTALWADNSKTNLGGRMIVQIFAYDMVNSKFAIRSEFVATEDIPTTELDSEEFDKLAIEYALASGGDRGYGYILRGMSEEDIRLFLRKISQLRRKHKFYRRFGRAK